MPSGSQLAKSQLIVIFVIEHVHKRGKEWVKVLIKEKSNSVGGPVVHYLHQAAGIQIELRQVFRQTSLA